MRIYRVTQSDADPTDPTTGPAAVVVATDQDRAIRETAAHFDDDLDDWRKASVRYLGVGRGPIRVLLAHN